MTPEASIQADQYIGPGITADGADGAFHVGTATTVGTSAAVTDLAGTPAQTLGKGCWLTVQARGGDLYVRFSNQNGAAGTTSGNGSNGYKIADGTTAQFWITPQQRYVDAIASAASTTMFWWRSSEPRNQNTPGTPKP